MREAYRHFERYAEKLRSTLTPNQKTLFLECESAYALLDGETMQYYYRAGFADAVMFFWKWRMTDS